MKLRAAIKSVVGGICVSPLLRPYVRRSAQRSVNVVYYHYVGDPDPHYAAFSSGCTASKFARDLKRLSGVFDFAPLSEVLAPDSGRKARERPTLAVTFDDGFDLRAGGAMEILDKFGVRATTFVITSCVDNRRMMWRHMLSAIQALVPKDVWLLRYTDLALSLGLSPIQKRQDLMSVTRQWDMNRKDEWAGVLWNRCNLPPVENYLAEKRPYFGRKELREWLAAGHFVGFHTHTHPYCSRLLRADLDAELIRPAIELKQWLGLEELSLSYPFGERLQPALEQRLFETRVFNALFGIQGFQRKGVSNDKLERAAVEQDHVGWSVFTAHAFGSLAANSD